MTASQPARAPSLGDPRDHRASPARAPQTAPSFSPHARALTSSPSTSGPSHPRDVGALGRERRVAHPGGVGVAQWRSPPTWKPTASPPVCRRPHRTDPGEDPGPQATCSRRSPRRSVHFKQVDRHVHAETGTHRPRDLLGVAEHGLENHQCSGHGLAFPLGAGSEPFAHGWTVGVHRLTRPPAEGPDAVDGAERGWSSRRRPGPMPPRPDRPGAMSSMPDGHTRHGPNVVPHPGTSAGRVGSRPARGSHGGRQSEGRLENPRERREIVPVHIDRKRVEFTTEIVEQVASRLLIQ